MELDGAGNACGARADQRKMGLLGLRWTPSSEGFLDRAWPILRHVASGHPRSTWVYPCGDSSQQSEWPLDGFIPLCLLLPL